MKTPLGSRPFLYPMPVALIGALVGGKPNYAPVAFCGIVNLDPARVAIGIGNRHHTTAGLRETGTFSVNLPSAEMVEVTDYCGLVSGAKVDKSGLFTTVFGKLATAPLIEECPLAMECRVVHAWDQEPDLLIVGEIVETYAKPEILTDGVPDMKKLNPLLFAMGENNYWTVGQPIAKAWSVGKGLKKKA
jgi:flavin reductase (DIM6/NTAB) family NADH-FMN oxidoreductase RutF